jgi:hypothetical protein
MSVVIRNNLRVTITLLPANNTEAVDRLRDKSAGNIRSLELKVEKSIFVFDRNNIGIASIVSDVDTTKEYDFCTLKNGDDTPTSHSYYVSWKSTVAVLETTDDFLFLASSYYHSILLLTHIRDTKKDGRVLNSRFHITPRQVSGEVGFIRVSLALRSIS